MPAPAYAGANVSNGNGVTTLFPYNFKILDQTHLEVKVDGVVKVLGGDYTVTGVGLSVGGNVVMLVAPANGTVVQRARKVPYVRTQDYQNNGDFKELTVDNDLDTIEMQVQQLAADMARAVKAPLSVTADQVLTDADWAARASKYLQYDAGGNLTLGGAINVTLTGAFAILDSIAALKTLGAPAGEYTVLLRGANVLGDGGGGFYYWKAGDATADNGGTVVQLNIGGLGRFIRLF